MKCPECHQNGIHFIGKLGLMFGLDVRCRKCGVVFSTSGMQAWLIGIGLHAAVWLAIIYALINSNTTAAYAGAILGYIVIGGAALLLPLKRKSRVSLRDRTRR